jgi:hypothetical protein
MHEHVFAGANTWMLGLLRDEYGASLNRVEKYDAVISMTRRVLAGAVALDVTAPASVLAGDPLLLDVRVTNLAGHKFPTGYPEGRRAWIQIFAGEDANASGSLSPAEITFASGAYDAATGVLTHDPQIVTYEAKLGVFDFNGDGACDTVDDATGREMFHFVLNDCVVSDDRIPPLGFVPTVETAPVGHVYPTDTARPPALVNFDDRAYAIPVPDAARGVFLVETRVLYQSSSREYVEFLRDESRATCDPRDPGCDPTAPDARASRGEKMHDLWESHGRSPPEELVMARSAVFVAVPPPVACCVSGTCEDLAPAECRAREGREEAAGSTCATSPCQRPAPAPAEPSDVTRGDAPVRVLKGAAGVLEVTYDPACDAIDHAAAWTPVSALRARSWPGFSCGHGVSGTLSIDPGPGSFAFVVVGLGAVAEGSYGRDSDGLERPQRIGPSACDMPQDLGASCR